MQQIQVFTSSVNVIRENIYVVLEDQSVQK